MGFRNAFYHDNRRNLTCVLDPQNGLTYYTYDAGNRMTSVKNPWGEVTYYEYSPGGRMTQRLLGNGCVTYFSYDIKGQTSKVENLKSDLSVISSFEYERDKLGNPVSILREDGYTTYYDYDAKSQLIGELQRDGQGQDVYAWTWDYDPAGNRTVQTFNGVAMYYEYNAANELTAETTGAETTYYGYDACGNTTLQQAPGGTTYYHWDHENLLTRIDLPGDAHNYFSYDADSKRVTKQDSEGFTRFIYQGPDMLKLLQEQDEEEELVAHYTMGQGLEAMRRDGASSFYHFDWLGSTFELTDVGEAVTDEYLYNAWGEVLARIGTTANPLAYASALRYYGVMTGVYLAGRRHYSGIAGRFLSADPIRHGANWYRYAAGLPSVFADPTGLKEIAGLPSLHMAEYSTTNREPKRDITRPAPQSRFNYMVEDELTVIIAQCARLEAALHGWWDNYAAWNHWLGRWGGHRTMNLNNMKRDMPEIKTEFDDELVHVLHEVRRLGVPQGRHRLVSEEFRFNAPAHDNWQKFLGTYFGYGIADVNICGRSVKIKLTLWRWDPFEFNCDSPPYRPPGSIGHAHTSDLVTDYVNEVAQTGSGAFHL